MKLFNTPSQKLSGGLCAALLGLLSISAAHAQDLASFNGTDGANPAGALTLIGNTLYGTTQTSGDYGFGTLFSLPVSGGSPTTLIPFNGDLGENPVGDLTLIGSTLYGTASYGGTSNAGAVYSLPVGGSPTTLGSFTLPTLTPGAGTTPMAGLTLSADGSTFYGTTSYGGAAYSGTIFSLPVSGGTPTTLLSFGGALGATPSAGLTLSGNTLYGTTGGGGSNSKGAIFSYNLGTQATFSVGFNGTNGTSPQAGLTLSADGSTLYGTTYGGGTDNDGTVFSFNLNTQAITTLLSFNGTEDGAGPLAGLTLNDGVLYGTTTLGGVYSQGTVFSLSIAGGSPTTLLSFNGADGSYPASDLTLSEDGSTLYGTTAIGGANGPYYGTVFGCASTLIQETYVGPVTGDWNNTNNWSQTGGLPASGGVPAADTDVFIGTAFGSQGNGNYIVTLDTNYTAPLDSLIVDATTVNSVVFQQTSSSYNMMANTEIIGQNATAFYDQYAGGNAVGGTLTLGQVYGSSGNYVLSGTATLTAANETIGDGGAGGLQQAGGTNTISGNLIVGNQATSSSNYQLQGGILTAGNEYVGYGANATTANFYQNDSYGASANNVAGLLDVGAGTGSVATYQLTGSNLGSTITAANEIIGDGGNGALNQSGSSTNTITGNLIVGNLNGSSGAYDISGGAQVQTDTAEVAVQPGSTGSISVDGSSSHFEANSLSVGGGANMTGGTGSFALTNGATAHVSGKVSVGANGTVDVVDNGGGAFTIGSTATLASVGEILVNQGGILGGPGSYKGDVTNGGTVAPGDPSMLNIYGDYTQTDAGVLVLDIAGPSSYDQLNVSGFFMVDPGATLELDFIDGFAPSTGEVFNNLISFQSISGDFSTVDIVGLEPGFDYSLNPDSGSTGYQLTALNDGVAAAPEPSTWALLLGGLGLLAFWRRRTLRARV